MRRVGVTQRLLRDPAHGEVRDALDVRWGAFVEAVFAGGARLVPIPTHGDAVAFAKDLGLSALIFSGGNDLSALS